MADDSYRDDDDNGLNQAAEKVGSALGTATKAVVDTAQAAAGAASSAATTAGNAATSVVERTEQPRKAVRPP